MPKFFTQKKSKQMKCSLITYHLSTAQTQTYPTTGAEEWRCYRSVDPCSSSAIHLPCNPPGEDKHIKKTGMRHFLQPSIQHHLAQSRKVSPRFAQQPLPNHYWIYHLSRHTYEFPALTKSCMLCSVTKGNGFAMPVSTIQSVTQKNQLHQHFWWWSLDSSEQYLQSHQVTQNKFKWLSVWHVLNYKYR